MRHIVPALTRRSLPGNPAAGAAPGAGLLAAPGHARAIPAAEGAAIGPFRIDMPEADQGDPCLDKELPRWEVL
jgi:hypothetical protein